MLFTIESFIQISIQILTLINKLMLSILPEWEEQLEEEEEVILIQREYDEMEETSEILLTQIASHPLLLEKEAEEIVLVEVEVEVEEGKEIVMVNQTPRSNQLLAEEIVVVEK